MKKFNLKLSKKIKALRLSAKLTQTEFGKLLNVSQDTISQWETGTRNPRTKYVLALSKIFNFSIDDFLGIRKRRKFPPT